MQEDIDRQNELIIQERQERQKQHYELIRQDTQKQEEIDRQKEEKRKIIMAFIGCTENKLNDIIPCTTKNNISPILVGEYLRTIQHIIQCKNDVCYTYKNNKHQSECINGLTDKFDKSNIKKNIDDCKNYKQIKTNECIKKNNNYIDYKQCLTDNKIIKTPKTVCTYFFNKKIPKKNTCKNEFKNKESIKTCIKYSKNKINE